MAVFPDRIVLKNSTDSEASIISAIESGGSDEITQGELVLGIETNSVKLYTIDASGNVIAFGGSGLGDLSDVTLGTPVAGSLLSYNGSYDYWEDTKYISINGIEFSTGNNQVSHGQMEWRSSDGTLRLGYENGVYNNIGQDRFAYCRNGTGVEISKNTAVMFSDAGSGRLEIEPAVADGTSPANSFLGITAEDIADGQLGQVKMAGMLSGFNTFGYADGAKLWCDPDNPGDFTATEPSPPNLAIFVGYVTSGGLPTSGKIFIRGGGAGTGIEEAPIDGNYYVRRNGTWVVSTDMFDAFNVKYAIVSDGGNFTTGEGAAITTVVYDGGDFTAGTSSATTSDILDGGLATV
jgi:hypothetical protein